MSSMDKLSVPQFPQLKYEDDRDGLLELWF